MNYKIILIIFTLYFLNGCNQSFIKKDKVLNIDISERYQNSGFALIYNDNLKEIKKIEKRSLKIYHKTLKKKSLVKITNPINGNSLIAEVKSNKEKFSNFYNSIISPRIAEVLELDIHEPYIQISLISENSTFVAKKAKMFDEEKNVAEKAPIEGIEINDLNLKKIKKIVIKDTDFSYSIKIGDFYYNDTAKIMKDRINKETYINNVRIIKLSKTKYRLLIGPFNDIKSLKAAFEKMKSFNFENLEILNNV